MNRCVFAFSILTLLLLSSCIPQKRLIYLQDKGTGINKSPIKPVEKKPYRVQSFDILIVNITATDRELSSVFSVAQNERQQQLISDAVAYFNGFSVDEQGNIRIPILGLVNVIGLTLDEIRIKIETKLLEEYFKEEANLFVTVKMAGMRYTVNGEINNPGANVIYQDRVNILEAIANSGDITILGDRKNVKIIRQFPQGNEIYSVDLTDISLMQSPYYYLQPNDYIYIEPLRQKTWGTGTTGIQTLTTLLSVFTLMTTTILIIQR